MRQHLVEDGCWRRSRRNGKVEEEEEEEEADARL
jgi:hypothetical protein